MAGLRALVSKRLRRLDAVPADWAMARARAGSVSLSVVDAAADVKAWARDAESVSFRRSVAGALEGTYWSVAPLRTPARLSRRLSPSEVVTLLCGASRLAEDPDSGAFLCVDWKTSAVFSFLFDDVVPSDPQPGDFVFEGASLRSWLRRGEAQPGSESTRARSLARRYRRSIWLGHCLGTGFEPPDCERVLETLEDGGTWDEWKAERRTVSSRPGDALFWLATFGVLGLPEELSECAGLTRGLRHPAVIDLSRRLERGEDLLKPLRWSKADRGRVREALRARLPAQRRSSTGQL